MSVRQKVIRVGERMPNKKLYLCTLVFCLFVALIGCSKSSHIELRDDATKERLTNVITFGYTSPFKGVFSYAYYGGEDDANILQFMHEGMFKVNDQLEYEANLAHWTFSDDKQKVSFHFKKGVKWHDGVELTAEDMAYAWYLIADPSYSGSRFSKVEMIKGAKEYKERKADVIEGIRIVDKYTVEVTLTKPTSNVIQTIWSYPEPKHYYRGTSSGEIEFLDEVIKHPIGVGPFKVTEIIPGEQVVLIRNDDYWQGIPALEGIIYKVIDSSFAHGLIQNGTIDIMISPIDQWSSIQSLENVETVVKPSLSYSYIGLKLGVWDSVEHRVVQNKDKFSSKLLRQAMLHAIDRERYIKDFRSGLGEPINGPLPSSSWAKIPENQMNTYEYSVEKAKQLLAQAGFKDIDQDGLVEDPSKRTFVIHFDYMSGSETSEERAAFFIKSWERIGLNVKLNGDGLKDFNTFYDSIEKDDPAVEVFGGAWGLSVDPDPAGIWLSTDYWNVSRWENKKSDELIQKGTQYPTDEAKDVVEYRKEIYYEWQKLMNEELPVLFLEQYHDAWVMNKRLKGVKVATYGIDTSHIWKWRVEN